MDIARVLAGVDIGRALKDEDYRTTLSLTQRRALTLVHVSGPRLLEDDQLEAVVGGLNTATVGCRTFRCNDPDIL